MTINSAFKLSMAAILAAFTIIVLAAQAHALSRQEIKDLVIREAENSHVPPSLAVAVAKVESDFNAKALSTAGARGVMQIMPKTAASEFNVKKDELWDPKLNIQLGIEYLGKLYRQYEGDWKLALSHYNGGTLKGNGRWAEPHAFTRDYVRSVMRWRRHFAHLDSEPGNWKIGDRTWRVAGNRNNNDWWFNEDWEIDEDWLPMRKRFGKKRRKKRWSEYDRFSHDPERRYGSCYADGRYGYDRYPGWAGRNRVRTSWGYSNWNDPWEYSRRGHNRWNQGRWNRPGWWRYGDLRERMRRARYDLDDFAPTFRRRI